MRGGVWSGYFWLLSHRRFLLLVIFFQSAGLGVTGRFDGVPSAVAPVFLVCAWSGFLRFNVVASVFLVCAWSGFSG